MEGKHSSLRLYSPIMERSSVSVSLRGCTAPFKAPSPVDLTCSCREEGPKHHNLPLKDFKESLLSFDKSSDIDWLSKLLTLRECQANMGNRQGTKIKQNLLKGGLFESEIYRKRRRGERRVSKSSLKIKMASGNPLKSRNLGELKTTNYLEDKIEGKKDISTKLPCFGGDFERDLGPNQQDITSMWNLNPAIDFLFFPQRPLSNLKLNDDNHDSDHSEYDNQTSYEAKSDQVSHRVDTFLQTLEEQRKETAASRIMGKIEEVEGIIRRVSQAKSKDNDSGRFVSFEHISKTLFDNDDNDMEYNDNQTLVTKELHSLGEALSQSLQQAFKVEERNSLKQRYQHGKDLRRPQYLPLNPCYCKTNSLSTSPTFPIASPIPDSPIPEPQREIGVSEETWWSPMKAVEGDCSNTNEQWMNWMREYGQIYTDASNNNDSEDELLYSDEALRRQEEAWQQEVEECLSLSHPGRPRHVDFLHLTALEEEDIISPAPTPPPPPPLSRELGSESPIDAEDRTPGRLQAVWPPFQEEEKVGLKYTEAEHQAALLQLKRECKEELEKIQEDYVEELSRLKEDSDDSVARLEFTIIELQSRLSQSESRRHGEVRDASVSTGDENPIKTFRSVCIQTDRETFMKTDDSEDERSRQPKVEPKKLDIDSISLNLCGQKDESLSFNEFQSHTGQTGSIDDTLCPYLQNISVPPPPPLPPPPPPLPDLLLGRGTGLLPPPPPLPYGCGVTSMDSAPRKSAVEPSRPMKPLYWNRIQIQDNNKETLWCSLEEPNINTCDFEDLFAKTTTQMKRKPLSEAFGKKAKTRKIVKLLDGKRSQAVGILISSLHLDMKDIQRAVLTVDNSAVDLDTIEALYENRAQPDELGRIKKHYETSNEEDIKLLDKPEQFLFELSQIPDFAGRASCIIFRSTFLDGNASVQRKLCAVSSVCEVLLERVSVKEIMGLVLALGNHMNGGSRTRGQADGFGLEILPKLKDVKSRDNRISLGDYVVSYYLHNVDKNAGTDKSEFPLPEPQDIFLAAQVKFEELHRDLRQLSRDLTQCEKNIQIVCDNSPEEHLQPFKDKMEAFVLSARKEHGDASYQLMTVEKSFRDLVVFFGLQPKAGDKEVTTSYFFMLWFEFCADFKNRWKRESKNISKERLKEAQLSVKRITGEKKVETRKINGNSLKQRLRQKEANLSSI